MNARGPIGASQRADPRLVEEEGHDPSNRIAAERLVAALSQRNFALPTVRPLNVKWMQPVDSVEISADIRS